MWTGKPFTTNQTVFIVVMLSIALPWAILNFAGFVYAVNRLSEIVWNLIFLFFLYIWVPLFALFVIVRVIRMGWELPRER